jgi:kinesin family protein 5
VDFDDGMSTVKMRSATVMSGPEKDGFTFDKVFPMETKQHEVFDYGVKELVVDLQTRAAIDADFPTRQNRER